MSFTKIGQELEKKASLIGIIRANRLTDDERETLKKYYGLDPDANLVARNAGRDILGGITGMGIGGLSGALLGSLAGKKFISKSMPSGLIGAVLGGMAGTPIGGITGTILATNKYSSGNAKEVAKLLKQRKRGV